MSRQHPGQWPVNIVTGTFLERFVAKKAKLMMISEKNLVIKENGKHVQKSK